MSAQLQHTGSPIGTMTPVGAYTSSGSATWETLEERLRTYGTDEETQVYRLASQIVTVPAGAPGTLDRDLTTLVSPDGVALGVGVVGKCVYLEIEVVTATAADVAVRRSAANALVIASGVVDAIPVGAGRVVLVDRVPNRLSPGTRVCAAPDFDATHKMLQLESTAGATVMIRVAIV